jgi:hypothetical protein
MKTPFESKLCPACNEVKPRSEYYKKLTAVSHKCKACTLLQNKAKSHLYVRSYRARINNWRNEKYANDSEYRDKHSAKAKERYERVKDTLNAKRRDRWANDPLSPDRKYYRRKDVKDKTPKWVDLNEILVIYANCPKGFHVDHIVPLRGLIDGRPVTGLHVPYNLQYLTPEANLKKKHRITETDLLHL